MSLTAASIGAIALGSSAMAGLGNYTEGQLNRNFNSAEALKQREFTAEQNAIDRDFNAAQAALSRDFSSAEALKQREFEERMSNTSYQRAFADMQKAGVNPLLAFGGSGAAVPTGAAAQTSNTSFSGQSAQSAHYGARVDYNNIAQSFINSGLKMYEIEARNTAELQAARAKAARNINLKLS